MRSPEGTPAGGQGFLVTAEVPAFALPETGTPGMALGRKLTSTNLHFVSMSVAGCDADGKQDSSYLKLCG